MIIDNVGNSQELYTMCPSYLTSSGTFLNLGGMGVTNSSTIAFLPFLRWAWTNAVANRMWYLPRILGGRNVGRKYMFYSAATLKETMQRVAELVQKGQLRSVVDGVWSMEDIVSVSLPQRARGPRLTHLHRHMRECRVEERRVKS